MTNNPIYAWHFSDGYLRFDYEGTKIETGLVLETDNEPVPEKSGFHACVNAIDALRWFAVRPSSNVVISRVRLGGKIVDDNSKAALLKGSRLVAQRREHLWVGDAKETLVQFADYCLSEWKKWEPFADEILDKLEFRNEYYIAYWIEIVIHSGEAPPKDVRDIRQPQFYALDVANAASQFAHAVSMYTQSRESLVNSISNWAGSLETLFMPDAYIDKQTRELYKRLRSNQLDLKDYFLSKYRPIELPFVVPEKKLHDMLMQLAPEGYTEP